MKLSVQDLRTIASASIPCPALFGLNQISPFISPPTYDKFMGSVLKLCSHFLRTCIPRNLCRVFFLFLSCLADFNGRFFTLDLTFTSLPASLFHLTPLGCNSRATLIPGLYWLKLMPRPRVECEPLPILAPSRSQRCDS